MPMRFLRNSGMSKTAPWATKLLGYLKDPASYPNTEYYDDNFVIIKDIFPKARQHYLLMPRKHMELHELSKADIGTLETMARVKDDFLSKKKDTFLVGFHSVPSMAQLHLHLISHDMISSSLKTKKHYLSFTTEFLIPLESVIEYLESGTFNVTDLKSRLELLKGRLKCLHCPQILSNIPKLKAHLETHARLQ